LKSIKRFTVNGLQQLLALMFPFELSDAGLLGNIFQLAPGFIALRLEPRSCPAGLDSRPAQEPDSTG
jgi:hypothetical protein